MSLITLFFPAIRYILNIVNENRRIAGKAYELISHLDIKTIIVCVVIIYVMVLVVSIYFLGIYFFKPFKFLRIYAVGIMLAVKRKYYDETELNALKRGGVYPKSKAHIIVDKHHSICYNNYTYLGNISNHFG